MMFYLLDPEVAGGFGENCILDSSVHHPIVKRLHYEMDGWLGDDILESFPCYIVTEHLRSVIEEYAKTGYEFDSVEITTSELFRDLYPNHKVPKFFWLKVNGKEGVDDFGISTDNRLVVSEKVFIAMKQNCQLSNCEINTFQ